MALALPCPDLAASGPEYFRIRRMDCAESIY